jgi:tetratricopeptide (TPR) repeat protein
MLFAGAGAALQSRKFAEAEALFRKIIARVPVNAEAHNWLGVVCQQQGKSQEALKHLRKAVELAPLSADYTNNLGIAELKLEDFDAARRSFEKAIALNPQLAQGHYNLGLVCKTRGERDRAIACFEKAIELNPVYFDAHLNLGNVLDESGKLDDAIGQYRKLVTIAPRSREAHFNLATALNKTKGLDEAEAEARCAISLDPKLAEGHSLLASILTKLGRFDEAVALLETTLAVKPDSANAIFVLLSISKAHRTREFATRIEGMLAAADRPAGETATLHFALGRIYDDLGEYGRAFENYQAANKIGLAENSFDSVRWRADVDRLIATFGPDYFPPRTGFGTTSRRPVFIFGMPRSGTTLVEQIVASHPDVAAGDELEAFPQLIQGLPQRLGTSKLYPECVLDMNQDAAQALAADYLAALDGVSPGAARVTDKNPFNFLHLGVLALLFPGAAFIHCRRNALDTCLSCYFQKFGHRLDFSFRLEDLGAYYRGYWRLMDHWRRVLPVPMLEVDYEELVADQERGSRRIISHCGLEWTDACLAFHRTKRPVATASVWQVRQPIYRTSMERWRHYEPFLGPLQAALADPAR